ncbi:MAG: phenylalanine--tRNA ligase subunit beta [Armatimonadota bacterium]
MRVPYGWLQTVVPVSLPVGEVADRLTMAGFEVEETLEVDGETVFGVKINSNRGDALSMVGIAREVAALTRGHVEHPQILLQDTGPDVNSLAAVVVEAPDLCPRYAARVIQGVKIGPSPEWVQRRLTEAGVRPINNVVDATNYVMLELGQPLHAFDLDTLSERTIVVRRARAGEPFTTLDGVERILTPNMLVIADRSRAVALAGIMGGENTEVTEATTNILLESAHFDRTAIRRTARANGLSTESSYRFERIVNPEGVVRAADRAAQLMVEWSGGVIARGVIDVAVPLPETRVIILRPERVNAVLGTEIPADEMAVILRSLELGVQAQGGIYSVAIPPFRPDLVEEMDLIEEVARIFGYQYIPTTVPGHITQAGRLAPEMAFEAQVRELLTAAGLYEGLSYSLIDYRTLDLMLLPEDAPERAQIVPLQNPKSEEYTHLRPTMFVSLLESLRNNARRSIEDVQVFELGRIFRNTGGSLRFNYAPHERRVDVDVRVQDADRLPLEQRTAGIALMGRPWTSRWNGGESEVDFFWLKGVLEQLLADMAVLDVSFHPAAHPTLHPGRAAEIHAGGRVIGLCGEAHPRVADNFDLPRRAYLAEVNIDALMDLAAGERPTPRLSRFPAVDRDIAFLVTQSQPADTIARVIRTAAGEFVESVELFDVYAGANIPEGMRSLAYRLTFRAAERTLADEEVDTAMEVVRRALVDEIGATLR